MVKQVLVPIADGMEEIETACIVDTLRRSCAAVTVAGVSTLEVRASRRMQITADKLISDCAGGSYDLIVLPGGMPGAENLRNCKVLEDMLIAQVQQGKLFAAICASPAVVFGSLGLLDGRKATCHPAMADQLKCGEIVDAAVVVDGNCITSQGPGTALVFALQLIRALFDEETAKKVAEPMLIDYPGF